MGHKYFKEQFDDEEVLLVFRKHPIVMRKGLIFSSLGIVAGVLPALIHPTYEFLIYGFIAGCILAAIIIFPFWVRWYFSVYIMTNQRFIQQTRSLLQVSVVDIGLDQVQMINYHINGFEQTLLGYGTIVIQTYVGELVIKDVAHPSNIQKNMIHSLRNLGIHASTRPGPKVSGDDTEDEGDEEDD